MRRTALAAALLVALVACGKTSPKHGAAPARTEEVIDAGWTQLDSNNATAIAYQDGVTRTGFSLTCTQATKSLRVTAPNPVENATPAAGEHASLILGAAPFEAPVTQTMNADVSFLVIDMVVTPQLLIALGDTKTARLLYRDGSSETGVDEGGKIVVFAQRCARLTGVEPAL